MNQDDLNIQAANWLNGNRDDVRNWIENHCSGADPTAVVVAALCLREAIHLAYGGVEARAFSNYCINVFS